MSSFLSTLTASPVLLISSILATVLLVFGIIKLLERRFTTAEKWEISWRWNPARLRKKLLVAVAILIVFNLIFGATQTAQLKQRIALAAPQIGTLITVMPAECPQCPEPITLRKQVLASNIEATAENELLSDTAAAKELITKYKLTHLPALVFTSDEPLKEPLRAAWQDFGQLQESAASWQVSDPPYFDLSTQQATGLVTATIISNLDCDQCQSASDTLDLLQQNGIFFSSVNQLDWQQPAGVELIAKYGLTRLPALLLSADAAAYPKLVENWSDFGTIADDGSFLLPSIGAPYFDLVARKVAGLVTVTYLTDKSCTDCYDVVAIQQPILTNFGLGSAEKKIVDRGTAAGQKLIQKYTITKVPTIILSAEVTAYEQLSAIWEQVGTVEEDGSFVFREIDLLSATYRNLTTGQIIVPAAPPQ